MLENYVASFENSIERPLRRTLLQNKFIRQINLSSRNFDCHPDEGGISKIKGLDYIKSSRRISLN